MRKAPEMIRGIFAFKLSHAPDFAAGDLRAKKSLGFA